MLIGLLLFLLLALGTRRETNEIKMSRYPGSYAKLTTVKIFGVLVYKSTKPIKRYY
jgi:hypothetical protein